MKSLIEGVRKILYENPESIECFYADVWGDNTGRNKDVKSKAIHIINCCIQFYRQACNLVYMDKIRIKNEKKVQRIVDWLVYNGIEEDVYIPFHKDDMLRGLGKKGD